jgi:mRNA interferase HigB
MHVISIKMLRDFWSKHPEAESVLRQWHAIVENTEFKDFAHIKEFFNSADYIPPYIVFDVAGNNYHVVVVVQYRSKRVYVREVMTHKEYDKWSKLYRKGNV